MTRKVTNIVAYLTPLGWILAYLAGDKDNCRFHLNQSLVIMISSLVLSIGSKVIITVLAFIPILGWLVAILLGIASGLMGLGLAVLWLIGLFGAIQDNERPIPILGGFQALK